MTRQTSILLRFALVQQAEIWQSLLLGKQSLRNLTKGYVTQRIINDFMGTLEKATMQELRSPVHRKVRFGFRLLVVLGLLLIIAVSISVLIPGLGQKVLTPLTAILSSAAIIVGVIGSFIKVQRDATGLDSPEESPATARKTSPTMRLIDFYQMPEIYNTLQKSRERILIEFGYLDQNVSITYQLVDFFILHSNQQSMRKANYAQAVTPSRNGTSKRAFSFFTGKSYEITTEAAHLIKDAYDFLTQIVWTNQEREDEIGRIVRMTYGPIGVMIGATIFK